MMIRLFVADISTLEDDIQNLALSEYRLSRLEKIKISSKRKQSIGAELLLNYAVQECCPQLHPPFDIVCGDQGRPEFKSIPLYFNVSHSGKYVACAISDELVGLDIENNLEFKPLVSQRFFNEKELELIEEARDKNRCFARIWTAKESVAKYYGIGLAMKLSEIDTIESDKYYIFQSEFESLVLSLFSTCKHDNINVEFVSI